MSDHKHKFIIATGGTGGHIFPAITLLEKLKERGHKCLVVADNRFLNFRKSIPKDIDYKTIATGSVSGSLFKKALSLLKIELGIFQALFIILRYKPKMVISFGGYVSFPTMVAALLTRTPLFIHEQNAVIGKSNRVLLKWADIISVAFYRTGRLYQHKCDKLYITGNPVRDDIINIRERKYPQLTPTSKIKILILGGSQGAKILSKIIPQAIKSLDEKLKKRIEIFQQCRAEDLDHLCEEYKEGNIKASVDVFFNDMAKKLSDVNLVICRSGAGTVSELIAAGRPAIFVPLPSAADNHQYFNAEAVSDNFASWIIEQKDFTAKSLSKLLGELLGNPSLLSNAAEQMRSQFNDTTSELITLIETFCSKK